MTTSLNLDIRRARLDLVTNLLSGGTLEFWSGARPAPGATPAGALQASTTVPSPSGTTTFPALLFTFGAVGDALRVDSQTITWARFKDMSGVWVMDVSVGLASAPSVPPEEILLGNVAGAVGAFLHIATGTIQG